MTAPDTLARVERVCAELLDEGQPVAFTAVAARSRVSRTSLYRDPNLRAIVEEHRTRSRDPHTLSGLASEVAHLRTAVETLAGRVRKHEEQLHRLQPRHTERKAN